MGQVEVIKDCLNLLCASSGQKLVMRRQIYFSRIVNHIRANEIATASDFPLTNDLGKYLGVSLHHNWVTSTSFSYVTKRLM